MVTIHATYEGSLRCTATHGPSSCTLSTDAPKDNEGLGASFSPTDLVATALMTCMVTTMAIVARRKNIELGKIDAEVQKHMAADPRRIAALPIRVSIGGRFTDEQKRLLETTARGCPVAVSLGAGVEQSIAFAYPDDTDPVSRQ